MRQQGALKGSPKGHRSGTSDGNQAGRHGKQGNTRSGRNKMRFRHRRGRTTDAGADTNTDEMPEDARPGDQKADGDADDDDELLGAPSSDAATH